MHDKHSQQAVGKEPSSGGCHNAQLLGHSRQDNTKLHVRLPAQPCISEDRVAHALLLHANKAAAALSAAAAESVVGVAAMTYGLSATNYGPSFVPTCCSLAF